MRASIADGAISEAYMAAEPRMVVEVLSPSTRDFDTIEKLAEYKAVGTLGHIVYVEPNAADVIVWSRGADRIVGAGEPRGPRRGRGSARPEAEPAAVGDL